MPGNSNDLYTERRITQLEGKVDTLEKANDAMRPLREAYYKSQGRAWLYAIFHAAACAVVGALALKLAKTLEWI